MSGVRKEFCVFDGPVVRSCGHETRYQCRLTDEARRQAAFAKLRTSPCRMCVMAHEEGVSLRVAREATRMKRDTLLRLAMQIGQMVDEGTAPDELALMYLDFVGP